MPADFLRQHVNVELGRVTAQGDRVFDRILQMADVAKPREVHQRTQGGLTQPLFTDLVRRAGLPHEVVGERGNVRIRSSSSGARRRTTPTTAARGKWPTPTSSPP
jgi:hypothetical protein